MTCKTVINARGNILELELGTNNAEIEIKGELKILEFYRDNNVGKVFINENIEALKEVIELGVFERYFNKKKSRSRIKHAFLILKQIKREMKGTPKGLFHVARKKREPTGYVYTTPRKKKA